MQYISAIVIGLIEVKHRLDLQLTWQTAEYTIMRWMSPRSFLSSSCRSLSTPNLCENEEHVDQFNTVWRTAQYASKRISNFIVVCTESRYAKQKPYLCKTLL